MIVNNNVQNKKYYTINVLSVLVRRLQFFLLEMLNWVLHSVKRFNKNVLPKSAW